MRLRLLLLASTLIATPAWAQEAPAAPVQTPPQAAPAMPAQDPDAPPSPSGEPVVIDPSVAPETAPAEPAPAEPAPAAPATAAAAFDPNWTPLPFDREGRSAYGLYLQGRVAGQRGDREASTAFLNRSLSLTPGQSTLADEAFRAALFSGSLDDLVRLAPGVADTGLLAEAGRLAQVVQALDRNDGRRARRVLQMGPLAQPYTPVGRYLGPVIAAASGDWTTALAPVETVGNDIAVLVLSDQRAQLLERRGRHDEADAAWRDLMATPQAAALYGVHYGAFLERRGRKDEALRIYAAALSGPSPDSRAAVAVQRLGAGGRAPRAPDLKAIAADALSFGALEATEVRLHELAIIYLRLAQDLHDSDEARLSLGQSLVRADHDVQARLVLAQVGRENPIHYAAAQVALADIEAEAGDDEAALTALRSAYEAAPAQVELARRLAAQLTVAGRYDEALEILASPQLGEATQTLDVRFLRGSILSQLGRIDEAEVELRAALVMAPENPILLNQLGYMWVDAGRNVEEGAAMLARAHAADPENGNIQDSLGWAQYRQGQYQLAVDTLEQAVDKQPGNAEIVDHLGDAYWQVGRTREAQWQWNRVLTLDPEPERRAEIDRKLDLEPTQPLGGEL